MVYMYHSFLIHLSDDGHLGCFHVLAIINSAVMNIGVHVSLSELEETQVSTDTLDDMDLIDIFRTFHTNAEEYTFISSAHGAFFMFHVR